MKTAVFAGTTEGRLLCEYLISKGLEFTAFTATEFGGSLLPQNAKIHIGKLNEEEIAMCIRKYGLVIDATHPYAEEVTKNIKNACVKLNKKYIRLLRNENICEDAVYAENIEEAVKILNKSDGMIFVSTGSKEAEKYTSVKDYSDRVCIRVLNSDGPLKKCRELGFKNIKCGMGPFSYEHNVDDFKGCKWLVTKSSGKAGGFDEKLKAAKKLGMNIIIISRPKENGYTLEDVKGMIDKSIITEPSEIERESFRIIEKRLENRFFPEEQKDIIKRTIHTTADFDYADNLVFSQGAVEKALSALKSRAAIVTDTNMALSGINKKVLESVGGAAYCFMADEDVAEEAKRRGITRAAVSVEKAAKLNGDVIFAVGNAPTALIAIDRLVKEGKLKPKFIIAAPVGFVNVIESKNLILNGSIPYIVAKGNKGGSNVAAAIVNALLYKIRR